MKLPEPYDDWEFKKIGFRIGGPDFVVLNDGRLILGTRTYFTHAKTAIFTGDAKGDFDETIILPSHGDTSYAGILIVGNEIWVTIIRQLTRTAKQRYCLPKFR